MLRLLLFQMLKRLLRTFVSVTLINQYLDKHWFLLLCKQIKQIKRSIDIFMISETKLHDSFPQGQFLIECFHSPFRSDRNKTEDGILSYVRRDIPAKVLSHGFTSAESFFVEIILHKNKRLIKCSCSPHKNIIKNHLEIISRTLDTFITKYENILLLGDLKACADDETMKNVCSSYGLYSFIKQSTYYKNPENPSRIDLVLTNKAKYF